jgi:rRNA maturation protein Nop10
MTEKSELVDKTIRNCDEVIEGHRNLGLGNQREQQEAYVMASLDRCPRCGDPTATLLPAPPLSILCSPCFSILKSTDDGRYWFVDMVEKIRSKSAKGELQLPLGGSHQTRN